ncbi:MAG: hypothetical protein J6O61_01165 [Butyrivibrio sp.]|uniref:hypothetical protein n=1 Tax=Butyrivibrio sp. TaxID=28121 RepID=UPI001B05889F|nr:hypothetical protein [Butyrivibrio sp.]MBO6239471.1 hypothetical protein [Butyrivibrio sp.]
MKTEFDETMNKKLVNQSGLSSEEFNDLYEMLSNDNRRIVSAVIQNLTFPKNLKPFVEFIFKKRLKEEGMSIYALKKKIKELDINNDLVDETIDSWAKKYGE